MKTRYTTIDLKSAIAEIQKSEALGLRLFNVYDIDNKTYLLRLTHGDKKMVLLIESGNRIHLTEYDWPKNMMPSGFSMKCRKHLKGRRLASVQQLGIDRIIDLTFGYDEAAYHLIVELYDRGNIILTDYQYNILQLLRNRTDTDKDVKFAVREVYPVNLARQHEGLMEKEKLKEILLQSKPGENLKKVLNPLFVYGPAVLEHCLVEAGLQSNMKLGQQFKPDNMQDMEKLMLALENAERILNSESTSGYIIQKKEKKVAANDDGDHLLTYNEFHPFLYTQHKQGSYLEFSSFNKCVDDFFSKLEGQKFEMNALRMEKAALKRLENVKQDHENRIKSLQESQDEDAKRAELIEMNLPQVEKAIATINSAIANQIDWDDIDEIVQEAKDQMDPVALTIKSLQLDTNHIVLSLSEPYFEDLSSSDDENYSTNNKRERGKPFKADVRIDLGLTAFGNARSMHNKRRNAALKEVKTVQASKKALKSAEKKTKETLKEVQTSKLISKTRKAYWFEKFYWFISSENYLVIGGRDQQQNELIVKRYLKPGDLYVHADLHGASSVILKNPGGGEVPPKTMNEAGTMAICYSAAWDARVVTSAWWVYHHQVSKTAPSGEYLTTGSFMIRGKKNYLPPSYLIMGFSILFKLDESCVSAHVNDRKVRLIEEETSITEIKDDDEEVEIASDDNDDDDSKEVGDEVVVSPRTDDTSPIDGTMENKLHEQSPGELRVEGLTEEEDVKEMPSHTTPETKEDIDLFPDTDIQLQHISGETFQLHRGVSTTSSQLDRDNDDHNEDEFVYLGDGEKVPVGKQTPQVRKPKLSAKQRRDLKKKNQLKNEADDRVNKNTATEDKLRNHIEGSGDNETIPSKVNQHQQQQQQPRKRGQKGKNKKIKEKYKDQDDEDRELMQQILRSHEPEKPPKKKGKDRGKQANSQVAKQQQKQQKILPENKPDILHAPNENALEEIPSDMKDDGDDDEQKEDMEKEHINILDSLTGSPYDEDVLLYAIPLCAPYSCLQSYKYKVKLTPGTSKRGRAARTAIGMFQVAKEATNWEKDLLKSLKDVDVSRNIPGKVKVSAPNLQRAKKK